MNKVGNKNWMKNFKFGKDKRDKSLIDFYDLQHTNRMRLKKHKQKKEKLI